jgi:hypothetical protein
VGITIFVNNKYYSTDFEKAFSKLGIIAETSIIKSSIINCLEQTSKDANFIIGLQGGYYKSPLKSESVGFIFIPYYYYEGEFLNPSKTEIEKELAIYLDENLDSCIQQLKYDDFSLDYKNSKSYVKIYENKIDFTSGLTVSIKKDNLIENINLEEHTITIESPLSKVLEVSDYITESHKKDPDFICLNCVSEMAQQRNLYIDFLDFDDINTKYTTLVVISENLTDSTPYIFEFLNKYKENIIS